MSRRLAGAGSVARWSRVAALLTGLLVTLLVGVRAALPPPALPAGASAGQFSAARAMADVRVIARRPHPATSVAIGPVRAYLADRLRALGVQPEERRYLVDAEGFRTLRRWNPRAVPGGELVDLVGVLPGRDRRAPAVAVMAHMDTVWGSPGAGDDSAGVAAALELLRAIRARGVPRRDILMLFTDGEEIGLSGARAFWGHDGLARHVGVVVNLEARGAGGRAAMFETGAGNGGMIALMRDAVRHPVANALAVMAYRRMPNDTDFTPARAAGLPGFNFAIMGRPQYYHSPLATTDRLDPRFLQDMGDQALDLVAGLAGARGLPAREPDRVFFDIAGRGLVAYAPGQGWWPIGLAVLALGGAGLALVRRRDMAAREAADGAVAFLWLAAHGLLALIFVNRLSGSGDHRGYYDRLAALPRLEAQAVLALLAVALGWLALRRRSGGRAAGLLPALLLALGCWLLGAPREPALAAAVVALLAAWWTPAGGVSRWGGWIGALGLLLLSAAIVQVAEPMAAWLLAWPVLILAVAAACAARTDAGFTRPWTGWIVALAGVLATAPLLPLAHLTFLGIGAAVPEGVLPMALIAAAAWWPLARPERTGRGVLLAVAALAMMAGTIAVQVRTAPPADTIPAYALDK